MAEIGFIGLGNMGGPMAANLVKAGHGVKGYDIGADALKTAEKNGIKVVGSVEEAAQGVETVITMLPAGEHVHEVYTGEGGVLSVTREGAHLIDCSTIDVASARAVHEAAEDEGLEMLDAPVSGGVAGAEAGQLTFMVGGSEAAFNAAKPLFDIMGKAAVHAGPAGNGQVAKACNNMILGISMLAISEAFTLAEKQGLDPQKLFDISSQASGMCWAMLNHNPVPGIVETAASNRDYKPGFAAGMMLKDLRLAQDAALNAGCATPMGAEAAALYTIFCNSGYADKDYSGVYKMLRGEWF
ncbi:3-hydroxyisobutyrate dehydrogenase [Ferruginivarius sediminum]|uniref:3-hydroxyisobutyrate dehydrogenase n=1 Tax=Ferruginivarius sediminum TaxID=2661937 RepID=A0A369TLI6_9PROT|nr:3-hydroxyisobutyrate dehydrogenase [Ferruginivarius sediminum]RDD63766.1 3-hydroxyisobutyrate dehydrogenase [Ferruginivarius sediminum]